MKKHDRHGDVLIVAIEVLPKSCKKMDGKTLAEGEVTGHSHTLECDMPDGFQIYVDPKGGLFFECEDNTRVVHQEHKPITFDKGTYQVVIQENYTPSGRELVRD